MNRILRWGRQNADHIFCAVFFGLGALVLILSAMLFVLSMYWIWSGVQETMP